METFKLWLENDDEVEGFKRLAYEKTTVSLTDVLLMGIHPYQSPCSHASLPSKFLNLLNEESEQLPDLAEFGYCPDMTVQAYRYQAYNEGSRFESILERIRREVRFVDDLTYLGLIKIAKRILRESWSHTIAYNLLLQTCGGFDEIRGALKKKDKTVKLSGYANVSDYDLGRILSPEDFSSEDAALIREAIPILNFRPTTFLNRVTDNRGLLKLTDEIRHFQLTVKADSGYLADSLRYNGQRNGDVVRLIPDIDKTEAKRVLAKTFSARWGKGKTRYCMTSDVAGLTEMSEERACQISFPSLNYGAQNNGGTSRAEIRKSKSVRYGVERFMTSNAPGDAIKETLRSHGVSMTGRKAELIEKLAALSADLYEKKKAELDGFFQERRYIRANNVTDMDCESFPVMDAFDLKGMILSMYVIKHLRGNTILESGYENDTFDLLSLARALINQEVSVKGVFLQVQ